MDTTIINPCFDLFCSGYIFFVIKLPDLLIHLFTQDFLSRDDTMGKDMVVKTKVKKNLTCLKSYFVHGTTTDNEHNCHRLETRVGLCGFK